jgi:hypothetical protein
MAMNRYCFKIERPLLVVLMTVILLMLAGCGNDEENTTSATKNSGGFTFMDLNAASVLDSRIRKKLDRQLGSKAVETSITLNLETAYPGFIQQHLPQLAHLNLQLNTPLGERVEHAATRLTYRYPKQKNFPFDFVSLVISNYTQKPMLFKIIAPELDGANLLETLKDKYKEPKIIPWEKGRSFIWEETDEIMIASIVSNRLGNKKYHIMIYYLYNIKYLIQKETAARSSEVKANKKATQSAF